jgi:hypothetical protein
MNENYMQGYLDGTGYWEKGRGSPVPAAQLFPIPHAKGAKAQSTQRGRGKREEGK